jgi:hypothetical protein
MVFFWTKSKVASNQELRLTNVDCHTGDSRLFNPRPIAEELMLCQRYYEKSYDVDVAPGTATIIGAGYSGLMTAYLPHSSSIRYATTKRITTIPTLYNTQNGTTGQLSEYNTASVFSANRVANVASSSSQAGFRAKIANGDGIIGYFVQWHWVAEAEL